VKGFFGGIVATLLVLACGVFAVSRLGLYPIGADNPPGALEKALAGRAMDVYADKHKPEGDNPVQPTAAALIEGATEYEEHCAFCHGGAKAKISPMRDKFSPPAPQLVNRVPHDPDAWLFWVTKHGVRMTGMPAWDAVLSDDEIWKVIAFIKHSGTLPQDVQSVWQRLASSPGKIEEHTPAQHEHPAANAHPSDGAD
jgi:mono/diheme cytochrome c family protein